jgi:osmotically-inducible protein OsmY
MQPTYSGEQLKAALAADPRVGELGIDVQCSEGRLYVTGIVTTDERRQAVDQVVREIAPDAEIYNDLTVVAQDAAPHVERLT